MSNLAIKVENLSKQYKIGTARYRHDSIRDHLAEWAKSLFVRNGHHSSVGGPPSTIVGPSSSVDGRSDTFWALKDLSFEIKHGESVGIIGPNGAGKSTLLKILSRITEPTTGYADIDGRAGSLLEVGTGFHGDLTGRENIYLNGAILGLKKSEIDRKFDEIVDFSGVEKFIDTPVKRYSSGMYVRLAFAVAAHLDSEILIIDEALAVGDAAFQQKCLGKMSAVVREGRTVLFVSHNTAFISSLTKQALVLEGGRLRFFGESSGAISFYLGGLPGNGPVNMLQHGNRVPGMTPSILSARFTDAEGREKSIFVTGETWCLEMEYACESNVKLEGAGFNIVSSAGVLVGGLNTFMCSPPPHRIPPRGKIRFRLPDLQLCPGEYAVSLGLLIDQHGLHDNILRALGFTVEKSDPNGTGYVLTRDHGLCSFKGSYEVETAPQL